MESLKKKSVKQRTKILFLLEKPILKCWEEHQLRTNCFFAVFHFVCSSSLKLEIWKLTWEPIQMTGLFIVIFKAVIKVSLQKGIYKLIFLFILEKNLIDVRFVKKSIQDQEDLKFIREHIQEKNHSNAKYVALNLRKMAT